MSRILLITRSDLLRAELRDAFSSLGHETESRGELGDVSAVEADIVVVETDVACLAGRSAVSVLRSPEGPRRRVSIVWTGEGTSSDLGLVFSEMPDAIIPVPVTVAAVGAALARMDRRVPQRKARGLDLADVDGTMEQHPPLRVLWTIMAQRAAGRLELFLDDQERELYINDGKVVAGRGFPEALEELGLEGDDEDDITGMINRAMQAGTRPDVAMEIVGRGIGRAMAKTVGRCGGMVFFDPLADPPRQSLPLPTSLGRMIAEGMRIERPAARVRRVLGPLQRDQLRQAMGATGPTGQSPVALRLWRMAADNPHLGDALGSEDDAWLAADLLLHLGLLQLQIAEEDIDDEVSVVEEGKPERKLRREQEATRSVLLEELLADRVRLRGLDAPGILGLETSADVVQQTIDERFRLMSARFHPDRYNRDGEDVRRVARDCFSMVTEAYAVLNTEEYRDLIQKRLAAREQGTVYVTDADRRRAKVMYAQGEVAFRRRRYDEALLHLKRAAAANPDDWKTNFLLTRALYEAGEADGIDTVNDLQALKAPEGRAQAEVLYHIGEVLLSADRLDAAFQAFEAAVRQYPAHTDANRRLRLRTMRQDGLAAVRQRDHEERKQREQERLDARVRRMGLTPTSDLEAGKGLADRLGGLFKRKG